MEFVLHLLLLAQVDNIDTMEFAIQHAQLEAALKAITVKEFALLAHGHTIMDATEPAQLNILLMMLVLALAQLEPFFKMEFVKQDHKAAQQDNIAIQHQTHARLVNTLALNAL